MAPAPGVARPAFNVLMAAYNASRTIDHAISSVLNQTRGDFELIVVDDGSADDTAERVQQVCERDRRVRLERQQNSGPSAARNRAIALGDAPYLTVLDSDDLLMPTYLEAIGDALDRAPDTALAYADAWGFDHTARRFRRRTVMVHQDAPDPLPQDTMGLLRALVQSNFIPIMFTVRRSAIERIGGFRETKPLAEDHELLLRVLANGFAAVHVPAVLGIYRRHQHGAFTFDDRWMLRSSSEALRIFADEHPGPDDLKALARARMDAFDRQLQEREAPSPFAVALRPARRLLGPIKRRVVDRDGLLREAPADVRAAFPDLVRTGF